MASFTRIFLLVLLFLSLFACSSSLRIAKETQKHMIALKGDGFPFDLEPDEKHQYDFSQHIHKIMTKIRNSNRRQILIYVHGGMKSIKESITDTREQYQKIWQTTDIYPVYINWESSMVDAYFEHLFYIRQGKYSPVMGPISSPFYFLFDLGRAVIRAPITWGHQGYNLLRTTVLHPAVADTIYKKYDRDYSPTGKRIYLGPSKRDFWDDFFDYVTHIIPGAVKIVTTPLLDAFGKSAWQNMKRRTQKVLRTHTEFNLYNINDINVKPLAATGGVSVLMDSLSVFLKSNPGYEVTLAGHSMGCIILAEIIQHYEDFSIDNIVFMAPALTIREFEHTVIPYLKKEKNRTTHVYILTLHPEADTRESVFYEIVPRGSLLEWVDDFASEPTEFTEVTLGKWENIIRALHIIPEDVRDQIIIKGFGYRSGKGPQTHGEFNDPEHEFWLPTFWSINPVAEPNTD